MTLFQPACESGPGGWVRCPLVSKSIRSNVGPFCSQLIDLPKRLGAYRLVEILQQPSGSGLDVAFFPVTHICRNGTRVSLAIPRCCVCVCTSVCEPTAPSMSHLEVLSLCASWHLLTPTIIMLIYIVWLHKVIYAQFLSVAAQRCTLLLLNVLIGRLYDHLALSLFPSFQSLRLAFLHFLHLSPYLINKFRKCSHEDLKASAYWENNSWNH